MNYKHYKLGLTVSGVLLGSVLMAGTAFAQSAPAPSSTSSHAGMRNPGVFGKVTAISGTTLTLDSKGFGKNATETTYSVDATNATVTKDGTASSLSSVAVGDTVMAQGTVSGTSVTATAVRDGMPQGMGGMRGHFPGGNASSTPGTMPQGNGEPVVGGTVSAVSGSTLTITNKSNVAYTIDGTNATVTKAGKTSTLSEVVVGDTVVVQGTVNGTSVTATSVLDNGAPKTSGTSTDKGGMGGFLGGIGSFFQHIFGFF